MSRSSRLAEISGDRWRPLANCDLVAAPSNLCGLRFYRMLVLLGLCKQQDLDREVAKVSDGKTAAQMIINTALTDFARCHQNRGAHLGVAAQLGLLPNEFVKEWLGKLRRAGQPALGHFAPGPNEKPSCSFLFAYFFFMFLQIVRVSIQLIIVQ